jgi:adenosylmethionine---8-amino-7-oxononanoate aminotransferase
MDLISRDLKHIWHPCSQMKDYEVFPPLVIKSAKGAYLRLDNGQSVIDGISSWWSKNLGHRHPRLIEALKKQCNKFEHVLLAHTCQEPLVALSEKLCSLLPALNKVFYASEGSMAVEIALKMSLHSRKITDEPKRQHFMALQNAYHGESLLSLSLSDIGIYRRPYESLLPQFEFIQNIPYVNSVEDPLWLNASEAWSVIEKELQSKKDFLSAIIVEPIIQGAGGMKIYSQDFLQSLSRFTKQNRIHLIFDEIMTGIGRLGFPLACLNMNIVPDFVCLSKGLTGGILPMSAVLIHQDIHPLFYNDYKTGNSFLHSNTFSGNALAAAVALQCLETLEDDNIYQRVQMNSNTLLQYLQEVAHQSNRLKNVRGIGYIAAAEFVLEKNEAQKRWGFQFAKEASRLGAFLRPLGNTLYWLPPLITSSNTMKELRDITLKTIKNIFCD